MFLHVAAAQDEQHYKSGAYALCVHGAVFFGVRGAGAGEHAYEVGAPYVLLQH